MLNTNVGDMPLDVFSDYVSDILDEEWCWIYLIPTMNYEGHYHGLGCGNGLIHIPVLENIYGHGFIHDDDQFGDTDGFGDGDTDGDGYGDSNRWCAGIYGHSISHKGCG
jgi:hypothetical protein